MRALIQRVRRCSVTVEGKVHSSIQKGVLVLLGVKSTDQNSDAVELARRCAALRIFDDEKGKMNLSVSDIHGSVMVVSQFTLYGDTSGGNRPSYVNAAPADLAKSLYEDFIRALESILGNQYVASGVFRAMMDIELVNDGPVTLMVESKRNG